MSLLPIADALVIEHRHCACGMDYLCPSPIVHRLLASPAGEPRKLVLQPRKESEFPMDLLTTHMVRVPMLHCPLCWEPNTTWTEASALVPKRPLVVEMSELLDQGLLNEEIRNSLRKAGFNVGPAKTDYDKALEL